MATIDDIHAVERLMQTLDENPQLLAAVRSRVLTQELLELPGKVAALSETVAALSETVAALSETVAALSETVASMDARLAGRIDQIVERMDRRFDQVSEDFTCLKDVGTITATKEQAHVIAEVVGLRSQRYLQGNEIIDLSRSQDTSDIQRGDLISFHRADLIMEATDDAGELHYIAIEVSFTADRRDTRRAIRNAAYLTRFTGRPAKAVVAAMRIDWEIQSVLDSGRVVWYRLTEDDSDQAGQATVLRNGGD